MPNNIVNPSNGIFTGTFLINQQNNNILTLSTANTFVDQNIQMTFNVKSASLNFSGGEINNGSISTVFNNIQTSEINNGITLFTSGTVNISDLICNGDIDGYVNCSNNTIIRSGLSGVLSSNSYNIAGVTLQAPSTGSRSFNISVPNGSLSEYITFKFTVDSLGNTYIE